MTDSFIAITGRHLHHGDLIFQTLGYSNAAEDLELGSWEACSDHLSSNYDQLADQGISLRGFWADTSHTYIEDPELVDAAAREELEALSAKLEAAIATFTVQTTSNTFGFAVYSGTQVRSFLTMDGEVIENSGEPLAQEGGLNIDTGAFTDDIFELATRLGINRAYDDETHFRIKRLSMTGELIPSQLVRENLAAIPAIAKPWWKFW